MGRICGIFVLISTIRIPRYSARLLTTLVEQIDGLWFRVITVFVVFALFLLLFSMWALLTVGCEEFFMERYTAHQGKSRATGKIA